MSPSVRLIDPRGQRFGAASSAAVLIIAIVLSVPLMVLFVGIALGASALFGTRWWLFGLPWPYVRDSLGLGRPTDPEPELGPRFAQALGAALLLVASIAFLLDAPAVGWSLTIAVAALQGLLAATGFCLGCRLYGLQWFLPTVFERLVLGRMRQAGVERRWPRDREGRWLASGTPRPTYRPGSGARCVAASERHRDWSSTGWPISFLLPLRDGACMEGRLVGQ